TCCACAYLRPLPTRRSSDLELVRQVIARSSGVRLDSGGRGRVGLEIPQLGDAEPFHGASRVLGAFGRSAEHARGAMERLRVAQRSEEHTSELQSRSDLVCRL